MATFYIQNLSYDAAACVSCESKKDTGLLIMSQGDNQIVLDRKQVEDLVRELKTDFNL